MTEGQPPMNQELKYKISNLEQKVRIRSKDAVHFAEDLLMELSHHVELLKPGMTGKQFASAKHALTVRSQYGALAMNALTDRREDVVTAACLLVINLARFLIGEANLSEVESAAEVLRRKSL